MNRAKKKKEKISKSGESSPSSIPSILFYVTRKCNYAE